MIAAILKLFCRVTLKFVSVVVAISQAVNFSCRSILDYAAYKNCLQRADIADGVELAFSLPTAAAD